MKRICGKGLLSLLAAIVMLLWPLAGTAEGNEMTGVFDFENRKVRLNSGYDMPILGLGTYALDHDACVNSVMALLESGRYIPTSSAIPRRPSTWHWKSWTSDTST